MSPQKSSGSLSIIAATVLGALPSILSPVLWCMYTEDFLHELAIFVSVFVTYWALKYIDFVVDDGIIFFPGDYYIFTLTCFIPCTWSMMADDMTTCVNMACGLGVMAAGKIDDPSFAFLMLNVAAIFVYRVFDTDDYSLEWFDLFVVTLMYFLDECTDHWADKHKKVAPAALLKLADFRILSDLLISYYVLARGYPTAAAVISGTHGYEMGREFYFWYVQRYKIVDSAHKLGIPIDGAPVAIKQD